MEECGCVSSAISHTAKVLVESSFMTNTILNIQFLRAVAALLVVFYHLQPMVNANYATKWNSHFGAIGVDIFFVISGFIMFYTNRNMERGPTTFIADRLLRIVPLYWLATLVIVTLFLIGFRPNGLHYLTMPTLIKSMIFVPSEFPDGRHDLVLSLGWTLMYELYFYAVFASTFFARSIEKSFFTVTIFFVLGTLANAIFAPFPYLIGYYLNTITLEFVFGALAAIAYIHWRPRNSNWEILLGAGLVILGVSSSILNSELVNAADQSGELRFLFLGVPAFLIVAGALV
jgi:exopolysaccharide production protein ExoZ